MVEFLSNPEAKEKIENFSKQIELTSREIVEKEVNGILKDLENLINVLTVYKSSE